MKKLIPFSIIFLLTVIFFACKKNTEDVVNSEIQQPNLLIEQAKSWFSSHKNKTSKNKTSLLNARIDTDNKIGKFTPLWDKSITSEDSLYYVVESPLQFDNYPGFIIVGNDQTPENNQINGITRLLILKEKKSGSMLSALMHVYSNSGITDGMITYTRRNSKFSGHIFYTDLNGEFINGWLYENGKIIKKSKNNLVTKNILARELPPEEQECVTYETKWYERDCKEYYNGNYTCGDWNYLGSTYQTYCKTTSDESGGGGGGGYTENKYTENIADANQDIIDSLQGYPCAQDVLKQLPKINDKVKEILQNVFGVNEDINIQFVASNMLAADIDGDTKCYGSSTEFTCKVRLNSTILNQASKDYIAAIFIHEAIHAYINHQRTVLDTTTFKTKFPIYWEYRGNESHHNEMATNYITMMSSVITGFNPTISDANSKALAWGGLQSTTAWKNNPDTNNIILVNSAGRNPTQADFSTYSFKKCDTPTQ